MYYQPPRTLGLLVGTGLVLWAAGVALLLLNFALGADPGLAMFGAYAGVAIALALAALFGFWTYALATLSYAVDRNGLVITWGPVRQVIPLEAIERLVPGTSVGVPRVRGLSWLGYHVGRAHIERIGDVLVYSTHQAPDEVLYVMTSERNYAITVADPASFAREIQVRQDLGPTAPVRHHVERAAPGLQGFWNDNTARLLVLAALAGAALVWLQLTLRYGGLAETLPISFPPGEADDAGLARHELFGLPQAATIMLAVNLVLGVLLHAWERAAGYALFIAAIAVQAGFFLALLIALS